MNAFLPLLTAALFAAPSLAQLKPGTFLATVEGANGVRGIFTVDRFKNAAARLSIVGINWAGVSAARTFVEDTKNFLMLVASGKTHVFRVTWSTGAWRAKLLTTSGTGPVSGWDFTRIGKWIYFSRSMGGNGSLTKDAEIYRLPATGGAATRYFHLSKAGVRGMPMAMVAVGTDLHVFMWFGPTTLNAAHVSISTVGAPKMTRRGRLPFSKAFTGKIGVLSREASYDARTGLIVIGFRTSDVLWRTPSGVTVRHDPVNVGPLKSKTDWGESLAVNTDTGAVLFGDYNGGFEEKVCLNGPWHKNVQSLPGLPGNTRIAGLEYVPSGSLYRETGSGCKQTNRRIPCNYLSNLPIPGNTLSFTVETSSQSGWFVIGTTQPNFPLAQLGAPGCFLGPSLDFVVPVSTRTATGLRFGPLTIPASTPKGAQAYVQFVLRNPANPLGVVTSDTRLIKL
jgi:hypothetical protein